MKRSDINPMPEFFDRYIELVEDIELLDGLKKNQSMFDAHLDELTECQNYRYAPGKWTPNDIIQHIMDNELIQLNRAMRISRGDTTVLPGYEEDFIADGIKTDRVDIQNLIEEFKILRTASINMFQRCTDEMLVKTSVCFNVEISALALGFQMIGHQIHHFNVIREKYFRG